MDIKVPSAAAGLAALVILAGCSVPFTGSSFDNLEDLATAAGCDQLKPMLYPMGLADRSGRCTITGHGEVILSWYSDSDKDLHDYDVDSKGSVDGVPSTTSYVYGDNWVVVCYDGNTQAVVADMTKGDKQG